MSWFTWNNVTINEIEPLAMQVFMQKDKQFTIKQSQVNKIGYRGMQLRAHSIFFNQTDIHEIDKYGICATVYWLDFTNSKIGTVQPKGFHLLAQNVNFMNNSFSQLESKAFNGIGPGLIENALVSFGRLKFTYVFSRNKILQANVGSLNPDWEAYKNVRTFLNFTLNHLPCSCSELGWVNLDDGLGSGFSDTVSFSTRIMEKKSQNMCVDAPCLLPLGVMSIMHFVNGSCQKASGLKEVCNKFINNKEFRTYILSESDKYTRNRASHLNVGIHGNINTDDALISDHPFPIVPVKSNALEKKTEYLNFWEGEPKFPGSYLHRVKRRLAQKQNETRTLLKNHHKRDVNEKTSEIVKTRVESDKLDNTGAYKVDWKLVMKDSNQDLVYVPNIIGKASNVVEEVIPINETSAQLTSNEENIPITIRPFGTKEEYPLVKGHASIHEQISSIAEKLTKDIAQQVQERQLLEQEEEALHELQESKKIDANKKSSHNNENHKKKLVHTQVKSSTKMNKKNKPKNTAITASSISAAPHVDWDSLQDSDENNENHMYMDLANLKQKLQKQYNNQTFPILLVEKKSLNTQNQ